MIPTVAVLIFIACAAALPGFVLHVFAEKHVQKWVARQMQGKAVKTSWDVRFQAAATAVENGIGMLVVYFLLREHLPFESWLLRGAVLAAIVLTVTGRLFRQPLMNRLVGNPWKVVLVQDGIAWLNALIRATCLVALYEGIAVPLFGDSLF